MESSVIYKNAIEKINNFYKHQYTEQNAEHLIFETLKQIIPFECGTIYMQNADSLDIKFQYCKKKAELHLKEDLNIEKCKFGEIEISRNENFSDEEKVIFKTCSVIISNIIKDIELSEIIKLQVNALQESIETAAKQNKKIIAADRIKDNFIANVSHELRSPLNSIIGFSELLQEQFIGKLNEKQLEYVSDIRIAGLHLLGMINEILDISKIEANAVKLNLTEFNLRQNINETVNILKPLYKKKNINLTVNSPENIAIRADYQKIQQIFFNLLSNAVKFTPEFGEINISASYTLKNLTITISDNGIGIDKKNLKKIFKKFMQISSGSEKESSTGLGLTITKELVKLHGGKIEVESQPSKGSAFIIKLPEVVI